jgi:small subunit ribosomal protein S6
MERRYETICIIKSDLGDTAIQEIVKKASASIETGAGNLNILDEWGRRRLSYPIEKKHEGFYVLFDYTSTPEVSKGLERSFRLNESVVRYQTVRLEGKAAVRAAARQAALEAKPDLPAETKPDLPAEAKPDLPAEVKPDLPAEVKPDLPAEVKPDLPAEAKPEAAPGPAVDDKGSEGGKDE